jgi:hypothetical protein
MFFKTRILSRICVIKNIQTPLEVYLILKSKLNQLQPAHKFKKYPRSTFKLLSALKRNVVKDLTNFHET